MKRLVIAALEVAMKGNFKMYLFSVKLEHLANQILFFGAEPTSNFIKMLQLVISQLHHQLFHQTSAPSLCNSVKHLLYW